MNKYYTMVKYKQLREGQFELVNYRERGCGVKVSYWWSEDGDPEVCERTEGVLEEATECYHCLAKLQEGESVSKLTSLEDGEEYIMCVACADKSTQKYEKLSSEKV